jgi:hypothetical protein
MTAAPARDVAATISRSRRACPIGIFRLCGPRCFRRAEIAWAHNGADGPNLAAVMNSCSRKIAGRPTGDFMRTDPMLSAPTMTPQWQ